MRTTMSRRKTRLSEEEAYRQFSEVFDLDLFALELEYNEEIGSALHEGVRAALDRRQRAFDVMLEQHPATLAENARRAEMRRLEQERLEKIAERRRECEERTRRAGVMHLARRWGAKLALARAG